MNLSDIQKALKAPKSQFNNFGKYNYRNCEDILEALKPLLDNNTLTISDEIVMIGNRFYVKATATLSWNDGGTNISISVTGYAREEESKKGMDGAQVTGAASSYARKYALNGLFLIDDTKDADSTNKHGKDEPVPTSQEIPPKTNKEPDVYIDEESCSDTVFAKIKSVENKSGETNGKKWKVYFIQTDRDKYGTFDEKIADFANTLISSGELGRLQWKQGKRGKEVVALSI